MTVADVLKDCAPYLRTPGAAGPFQLYHQSLGDYLREPGDHNINPAEASKRIISMLADHQPDWDDSTDTYAVRYLLDHLADVLLTVGDPDREQMLQIAGQATTDPGFLCAASAQNGSGHLLSQLARLDGVTDLPERLRDIYRVLSRQVQILLGSGADARPGFLLQQLAFQAHAVGATALGDRLNDHADARSLPGLRTRWVNPGTSSSSHLHTLRCRAFGWQTVAITPDSTRAVLAPPNSDRAITAQVWDLATGTIVATLLGGDGLMSAVVTPDGNRVVAADEDGAAGVWDLNTGRMLFALSGGSERVRSVAITPDGTYAITAASSGRIQTWNLDDGTELTALHVPVNVDEWVEVTALAVTPDGERLLTGCTDGSAGVWGLTSGRLLHNLPGHRHEVFAIVTTPDGERAVTGSMDGTATVWDLQTGTKIHVLRGHQSSLSALAIAPDGTHAVTTALGAEDACVWDLDSGRLLHKLPSEHGTIWSAAVTADGTRVITGCTDGSVTVWNLTTGQLEDTLTGHQAVPVRAVATTPDGSRVVTCCIDGIARVWALTSERRSSVPPGHAGFIWDVAVTPEGTYAITGSADGTARIWDVETGRASLVLSHGNDVEHVAITPDGARAVTVGSEIARAWDLSTGREIHSLPVDRCVILATAITADGTRVLFGLQDKGTGLWDLRAKPAPRLKVLYGLRETVDVVATTPDGAWAVTDRRDGTAQVWDIANGQALHVLAGSQAEIDTITITLDGSKAIAASRAGTIRSWELATGRQLDIVTVQWENVDDLAISPDGTSALTGSWLATGSAVRLWDLADLRQPVSTLSLKNNVTGVAIFTGPRERILVGTNDGMITCFEPFPCSNQANGKLEVIYGDNHGTTLLY